MTTQPTSSADALLDLDARAQVAALARGDCSALEIGRAHV